MSLARLLAQGLVCEEIASAPCGECTSCRKVHGNNHADVWTESPSGKSQTIVVDQVQELQRRLASFATNAARRPNPGAERIEPARPRTSLNFT